MGIFKKTKIILLNGVGIILVILFVFIYNSIPILYISPFPDGKNFAFTITDDPDGARLDKIGPIYEFLDKLGFKTTIACWIYKPRDVTNLPDPQEQMASQTLENQEYLEFLKEYQGKGFEIALHTVTSGHDRREITISGYERFKETFGYYPAINIMHSKNKENIYWGQNIFKGPIMKMLVGLYDKTDFSGENPDSPYFWGDTCRDKTKYVRLWGTSNINTLKLNPSMPYHDISKPYVNYWFSFSDGYTAKYFKKLLSPENVRKLIKDRGACIVYTHFAAGFCKKQPDGSYVLDENIKNELINLAKQKEGWFVPAKELLDRLLDVKSILITHRGKTVILKNINSHEIKGLTILTKPFLQYVDTKGNVLRANEEGEMVLGNLSANEMIAIDFKNNVRIKWIPTALGFWEKNRLVWERLKIMVFSHRG